MNLGDGLLFELENGKPKLILLSHGVQKNPAKMLFRPRVANILSSRQPGCLEEERPTRQQAGRHKAGGAAAPLNCRSTTSGERSTSLMSSKTHEHHNGGASKAVTKVKADRLGQSSTVGSSKTIGKTGKPQNSGARAGGKVGLTDTLGRGNAGQKDKTVILTSEQLQQILNNFQAPSNGQQPPEDHKTQGSPSGTLMNIGGGVGELKEEDRGGAELKKGEGGGVVNDTTGNSQEKDESWLEEQESDRRSAIKAKKAQWRRELDKQVALKQQQQQRSTPDRLKAEEDTESVLSVQSSISHRELPSAIRSSLKLGEFIPMEEGMSVGRKEEQRRRWLQELDRQREETAEHKRREKLLQDQTEDHELWTAHFDSMQPRPPVHSTAPSAPPPGLSSGSERREWEPSSSLSLVWEASSSCGAESVGRASVDTTNRNPSRTSYLRTMTALLDPIQIEERERRRIKQLEHQREIEAQMEERRCQREREEAKRREEEEEDERRMALDREKLQKQYALDAEKRSQKEHPRQHAEHARKEPSNDRLQETLAPSINRHGEHLEEDANSSVPPYKDTAAQTEAAPSLTLGAERDETPDVSAQYQPPPRLYAALQNNRNPAVRKGKENISMPGRTGGGGDGGDPYEAFARTERNRRETKKPEWNTQRPSRQFVSASERYPAALQRSRQESRLKRQTELLALQERACQARSEPPPSPLHQDPRLCSNPTQTRTAPNNKVEAFSRGQNISAITNDRSCSPPIPAVRHRVLSQQATKPLPPFVQEFIPYIRTDEITLDPLEPAVNPLRNTYIATAQSSASPPARSQRDPLLHPEQLSKTHTNRQQEILRGLAQLRQGLLQKQRELETDLTPQLKRHDNKV